MTYLFYFLICLFLLVIKTTILSDFFFFIHLYDLQILIVFYLGLFRPFSEGLPTIIFLGFVMDAMSGGPFGLYSTTYFWLYACSRWLVKYLHAGNVVQWPFIIASGVLVENLVYFSVIAVLYPEIKFSSIDVRNTIVEIVLALCTGPFLLMFISYLHKIWEEMFQDLAEDTNDFF